MIQDWYGGAGVSGTHVCCQNTPAAASLGALVKSQNRDLETITYKLTFHYFEGIQEWNLVLQADRATQRDGAFSNNTTYQNAWYFDQKYTDNDLTSVKGN